MARSSRLPRRTAVAAGACAALVAIFGAPGRSAEETGSTPDTAGMASRAADCASGWELDQGMCFPACPAGYSGAGLVCRQRCPPDAVDEGSSCRRGAEVSPKESQSRGLGQLRRSDYRGLFANFVQLYRAAALLGTTPLTDDEKAYLKAFFPARLVEQVRLTTVPALQLPFVLDVSATTIGNDLIVVKDGRRSASLLKHELVHVCQADRLGLDGFIREYADQYVDAGYRYGEIRFEREAYAFDGATGPISGHLGYCE